jgi:Mrp family chromosome partitioning ATPase
VGDGVATIELILRNCINYFLTDIKRSEGEMRKAQGHYNPMEKDFQEIQRLNEKLSHIKNKILVLSGKGGVGKSTVSANLAVALARQGYKTGLLDIDVHGPSIPKILGLETRQVTGTETGMNPVLYGDGLKVISIGLLIGDKDDAVIWRGPLKYSVIKQFIRDVDWGELDYLIVDSPPGTGDEPLTVAQTMKVNGSIIVSTPQDIALLDARKTINFSTKMNIPVIGLVENMSTFICPHCGHEIDIFKGMGVQKAAEDFNLDILGKIPLDPKIVQSGDKGVSIFSSEFQDSVIRKEYEKIAEKVIAKLG